jgi:diguanylate cyclase (GGDEF)-like protein/PAS domain S-box-containing protein/putative nucleotidyltransferase with HDIG domain
LELNCRTLATLLLARDFEFLGVMLLPAFGILFIAQLTKIKVKKEVAETLLSFSGILWILFITNPLHSLFYKKVGILISKYGIPVTEKGPAFYLFVAYVGVFLIFSSIALIRAIRIEEKKIKKNSFLFALISFQIPWFAIIFILSGLDTFVDPVPATIMIMCILFLFNEIKNDMFELEINRWKTNFLNIGEPAFLVDRSGEIVCSNMIANNLFKDNRKSVKEIIENLSNGELENKPVFFTINNEIKWFDVRINNFDIKNKFTNYLLIDVTAKKNTSLVAETFLNAIKDFVFICEEKGKILFVNKEVKKRLGYSDEEIRQMHILDLYPKESSPEAKRVLIKMMKREESQYYLPMQTKDKKNIPLETRIWLGDWNGKNVVYGLSKDISLLRETVNKFEKSFYKNPAIMAISDYFTNKYININDAFIDKLGYSKEEIIGKTSEELMLFKNENQIVEARKTLQINGRFSDLEIEIIARNGDVLTGLFYGELIQTDNSTQLLTVMLDITTRKKAEEEILYLSLHDQLTGLFNRRFYEEELKRLDTERNLPMTIVIGDVNGLKLINDSFGHVVGDELLKKAASVIKKGCRSDDIIARLGGDEFVIILPKTNAFETEQIIRRIKDLSLEEKVGSIDISITFGHETKNNMEENIDEILKITEDHMYRHKLSESSSVKSKTIDLIMNTLYEKNNREMFHSNRVSKICEDIATQMNFNKDGINQIRIAGLMHDIGKIVIDEKILDKPEKLNFDEWKEIEKHSEIGYRILSSVNEFSEIAEYILEHHEKWNGEGYPRGLKGKEISLQARIISVADAYDAITGERTYSKALNEEDAINEIKRCSGIHFDPEVSRVLIEKVLDKKWL